MTERIALLDQLFQTAPQLNGQIEAFLADQEFIGADWLVYLREKHIPRCIRIRKNFRTGSTGKGASVETFFRHLKVGQEQTSASMGSCCIGWLCAWRMTSSSSPLTSNPSTV